MADNSGSPLGRAYSFLTIKSIDEDQRIISGIASTPTADRMGDVVEPMGAKFSLPMPLLWQHRAAEPIGQVISAKATKDGIPFVAKIAKTSEPGKLKDRLDEAWQSIKLGLVRAVSIGFQATKAEMLKDGSGFKFSEWEWLELSAVTIPANADATIQTIRSLDTELRAATGRTKQTQPATRQSQTSVKAKEPNTVKKTVAEQISAFEATRAAKAARMEELMNAAAEEGQTLDEAAKEEYDTLEAEVKEVDDHLVRLHKMEVAHKAAAVEVNGKSQEKASASRSGVISVKKPDLPQGTAFTRYVIALARARGNRHEALEIAKTNEQWMAETPDVASVLKSAVAAGTTTDATWAGPLVVYQQMASEFIEFLRPQTVLGRIGGFRRVPFNISVPRQTAGTSVNWVGQGRPKPLSKAAFDTVTMKWAKAAGIVVLTDELIRFSNPAAEGLIRADLAAAMAKFLDEQFLDPSVGAVADVSPASITNGADNFAASGETADAFRNDVKSALANMILADIDTGGTVIVMSPLQALSLGLLRNNLSQDEFPGLNATGGSVLGYQVLTTNNAPSGQITFIKPSEVLLADDGNVTIDASREASLHLDDTPTNGESPNMVSMWQNNMVAIRAERYINWLRRRNDAVTYITGADYGGLGTGT